MKILKKLLLVYRDGWKTISRANCSNKTWLKEHLFFFQRWLNTPGHKMECHPRYLTLRKNTIKKNNWIHILNLPKKKIQTDLSESRESGQIDCEHRLCSTKKHESWTRKFSWSVQCRGRQNGQWNKAGLCPILWLCNKLHNKEEKGEKKAVDLSLTRNVPKKVTNKKWLVNSVRVSLCIQIFLSTGAGGVMAG